MHRMPQTPSVGRVVHYVSYGTPGGEYTSECRAADITEVDPHDPTRVGLFVKSPTGLFFQSLADGGCAYDEGALDAARGTPTTRSYPGGTWHWPERV
jgi:hypothetical protein